MKKISSLQKHVLHGNSKDFTSFLLFLELQKSLQPDNASEISTEYGSRKRRKADKLSVGGRLSDHLLPCHSYEDDHPKKRDFEGNIVALMAHEFT